GTFQGMLEMLDIPYVGFGVLASAAAMDKCGTKLVLHAAGLECAPGIVVYEDDCASESHRVTTYLRYTHPLPRLFNQTRAGSSLGVTRVSDPRELEAAMGSVFAEDPKVLVEEGLDAREVECGVLQGRDGREPSTTLPGEVKVGADLEFYDYEAK